MSYYDEIREIGARLEARAQPGERLADTFDRLMRRCDVAMYDRSVVENAKQEARGLRILIASAIEQSPEKMLRISRIVQESLNSPGSIAIRESHDLQTGDVLYTIVKDRQ